MSERWRILALMTGAQAGGGVVQQALGVLAPFFILQYGVNKAQLGALFTAMNVGAMCFTAFSGVLTDRFGERPMVAISGALMALALVLAVLVPNYVWLAVCIGIFGVGYAVQTPAGGRAILSWFDRDRGLAMGIRQTGVPIGGMIGALVMPFVALHFGGYRPALLVSAAIVAVLTLIAVVGYRERNVDRPAPAHFVDIARGMRTLARDPRLIAVTLTSLVLINAQLAMNGFLTVTAIDVIGKSPQAAAAAFAWAFVAATVARLFWGWYSDRFLRGGRVVLMGVLCGLAALSALLCGLLHAPQAWLFVPVAMLMGFSAAGWNGIMAAALAEIGGPERAASALGITMTAIFAMSALGPLVFGAIADATSLDVSWLVTAAFCVAGVLPVLWLRGHQRRATAQALH
jgi:MFS family permease